MDDLYPWVGNNARGMIFVDGENLAMRYGEMARALLAQGLEPVPAPPGAVWYEPDVAVWGQHLSRGPGTLPGGMSIVRKYYYTSVQGDEARRGEIEKWLKTRGIEAPRVFPRDRNRGSKQVDITLATDMLTHAHRKHYDFAVLVAGDQDYIPLVRAVKAEGARVHIWSLSNGLSPKLRAEADHFALLNGYFGV